MTPRGIPALRMLPHMGPATTAPARSVNYIVNHMCEHICEPIQSTGRILPGGPGITMCAENTAYDLLGARRINVAIRLASRGLSDHRLR